MSDPFITNEDLSVEVKHDVYPFINPSALFKSQAFKGKVVLVTGASRGIGQETAVKFGQAGASVVLVARTEMALEETKSAILKIRPDAKILAFSADVTDAVRAKEIVGATVAELGRLDILVANAGIVRAVDAPFTAKDPLGWWKVLEVNLRGVYNYAHFAIPYLKESSGTLIAVSSCLAQIRIPFNSEYGISKLALSRFIEYAVLEHTEISAFSVHPGMIAGTEAHKTSGATIPTGMEDTAALPAAVFLFLASGRASYLNGRYVSVNWDLEQVEREWKDKIIKQNSLVSKLSIPVQS